MSIINTAGLYFGFLCIVASTAYVWGAASTIARNDWSRKLDKESYKAK